MNLCGFYEVIFTNADKNGDGCLSEEELRAAFKKRDHELSEDTFKGIDTSADGKIQLAEFIKYCKTDKKLIQDSRDFMEKLFNSIDTDNSGELDISELASVMKARCDQSDKDIEKTFKDMDKNKDNKVSKDEFINHMTSSK